MKYCFGDIVIVEELLIGVIVKSWIGFNCENKHDVYVRNFNQIRTYKENDIERYMVRHKELDDEERNYQNNCYNQY